MKKNITKLQLIRTEQPTPLPKELVGASQERSLILLKALSMAKELGEFCMANKIGIFDLSVPTDGTSKGQVSFRHLRE